MLSAKHLLTLTWDELKVAACREINEGLGNKGPWKHDIPHRQFPCHRCGWMPSEAQAVTNRECHVSPPITDPVEVVAERLIKRLDNDQWFEFVRHVFVAYTIQPYEEDISGYRSTSGICWIFRDAPTHRRIIVCLLALGLIGE